jgi:hypothetical protein
MEVLMNEIGLLVLAAVVIWVMTMFNEYGEKVG